VQDGAVDLRHRTGVDRNRSRASKATIPTKDCRLKHTMLRGYECVFIFGPVSMVVNVHVMYM
jgi:hypothetical protein